MGMSATLVADNQIGVGDFGVVKAFLYSCAGAFAGALLMSALLAAPGCAAKTTKVSPVILTHATAAR
jgi:hypothetical protein